MGLMFKIKKKQIPLLPLQWRACPDLSGGEGVGFLKKTFVFLILSILQNRKTQ